LLFQGNEPVALDVAQKFDEAGGNAAAAIAWGQLVKQLQSAFEAAEADAEKIQKLLAQEHLDDTGYQLGPLGLISWPIQP